MVHTLTHYKWDEYEVGDHEPDGGEGSDEHFGESDYSWGQTEQQEREVAGHVTARMRREPRP